MKKSIILVVSLVVLISPCFAGNLLQQQDELKFIQKVANDPLPTQYGKDYLIREDYYGYWNGKNSGYGAILYELDEQEKSQNINKQINIKYLKLMKNKIDTYISTQNNYIDNNKRRNIILSKIIINDNEYLKLTENTKLLIYLYNYIFCGD